MKPLFTEKQVGISAVLGGPIPPGILFFLNYRRINREKESFIALAATLIFTIGLFYTVIKLPDEVMDKIPNSVFTAIYGVVVYLLYNRLLAKDVNLRLKEGSVPASNWTVAGLTVLGLVINVVIILALAFSQPAFDGDKATYGAARHEIYHDKTKTTPEQVNKLGEILTNAGFFTDEFAVAVHLDTRPIGCTLTLQIDEEYWTNPDVKQFIMDVKSQLQDVFGPDVVVVLQHYNLSGTKELRM